MKLFVKISAVAAMFALAAPTFAQQKAGGGDAGRFGVGVGVSTPNVPNANGMAAPGPGTYLFIPMNLAPNLRVEPFVGWLRTDTDAFGKTSDFTLGVGAFFLQPVASQVQLYAGGRLGVNWVSSKAVGGDPKDSRRDIHIAAVGGGEYLATPRVALGAELSVAYASIGDTKTTTGGTTTEGGGGSATYTQGILFARVFLF